MGYTTTFEGSVTIEPPLSPKEVAYVNAFSDSRRMDRESGPYTVESWEFGREPSASDILDGNGPPSGQPGLWCQWVVNEEGTELEWDQCEKFYNAEAWMKYLIEHFLGQDPLAKSAEPANFEFLDGHTLNGEIFASGEESGDLWKIEVRDNRVNVVKGKVSY